MSEQEEVERSLAETRKMLREQYPDIGGKPHPIFEMMIDQMEKLLLNPDTRHEMMARHTAGATIVPIHPFTDLKILRNNYKLSHAFVQEWVVPYYMEMPFISQDTAQKLISLKKSITKQIVEMLLGD